MNTLSADAALHHLQRLADAEVAAGLRRFFKTAPGQYGHGDIFLGIRVPQLRALLPAYQTMELAELARLLASPLHEARLLALLLLVRRFAAATAAAQRDLYHFYFGHIGHINNWDLVDASAPPLVGGYLSGRSRRPLYRLAVSASLWERRIAIVATLHFIRNHDFDDTLRIAEQLLDDREDLLHKACGWMLREVGKRDLAVAEGFILRHGRRMPRTMLRYLLECFPEAARRRHLRETVAVAAGSARPARKRRNER